MRQEVGGVCRRNAEGPLSYELCFGLAAPTLSEDSRHIADQNRKIARVAPSSGVVEVQCDKLGIRAAAAAGRLPQASHLRRNGKAGVKGCAVAGNLHLDDASGVDLVNERLARAVSPGDG